MESLATALRLSDDERRYLFLLSKSDEMIEKFKQESELFRSWWPRYEVKTTTDCHKLWSDPLIEELEFEHVNLQVSNCPDLKLMIYTASPSTAEKLKQKIYS